MVWAALAATAIFGAAPGCSREPKEAAKAADAEAPPVAVSLVAVRELKTPRVVTLSGMLAGAEEAGEGGDLVEAWIEAASRRGRRERLRRGRQGMDDPGARGAMTDDIDRVRILDDDRIVIRRLDAVACHQPATDRGMILLDPRVDHRDANAAPVTPAEREVALECTERTDP
jgi:hypothetical protein